MSGHLAETGPRRTMWWEKFSAAAAWRHHGLWWLAHQLNRHVERIVFVLLAATTLTFTGPWSTHAGALLCASASAVCAIVYLARNRSLWRDENRFVRTPWLAFSILMAGLTWVFIDGRLPNGLPGITAMVLLLNLLLLEFRNRRFLARKRVSRRRRQHVRWQRQRRELQLQLQEGLKWMAALQHDVRQPLQALGLLLSSPRISRDPKFELLVQQLQGCHQWIYELSENATEIAAIQAHQPPPPELAPVDVFALVSSFSNWTAPLANSKGLRVIVALPAGHQMHMITTDARKLKRVLANLLHNALRYTPAGEVSLTLRLMDGWIEMEVADEADPLPAHVHARLATLELPDPIKGGLRRGLGLFVVTGFCRQMGWALRIERRHPRGNRITLIISPSASLPQQSQNVRQSGWYPPDVPLPPPSPAG